MPKKKCNCKDIKDKDWDNKEFIWDKTFYTKNISLFFHMPLNMGKAISKAFDEIKKKKLRSKGIIMQKDAVFNGKLMIELNPTKSRSKNIENLKCKVLSKVHIGPFKKLYNAVKDLEKTAKKKDMKIKSIYFWFTTCPECTKNINKYKTVVFAEVKGKDRKCTICESNACYGKR